MSTAAGLIAVVAASASLATAGGPSGSGDADTVVPSFRPVIRFEVRVPRRVCLRSPRCAHPRQDRRKTACPPSSACESSACPTTQPVDTGAFRQDDFDIVELDRTGRADVECLEKPMRRIENRRRNPVRIDQPVGVLQGRSPVTRAECRGKDAGIADAGAAELNAARKQRDGANAELDGLGLQHRRPVVLGLERDVGNFDGEELRTVDGHPRRSEDGLDIHARKAPDRGLGLVAQPLRADPAGGEQIKAAGNDDRDRRQQGRGSRNAPQRPPADAAALLEMILAGRRRKCCERTYLAAAKPDLFVS